MPRSNLVLIAVLIAPIAARADVTERVSVLPGGIQAAGDSTDVAISADARFVGFSSLAANLAPNDSGTAEDVFRFDRVLGTLTRVSSTLLNFPGNGTSRSPAISADGQVVAFESGASNLCDVNSVGSSILVFGVLVKGHLNASVSTAGTPGNDSSFAPALSADGRFVAFASHASNLVANDTNGKSDVFLRDLANGTTVRVSSGSGGAAGTGDSFEPALSADGRFVAFASNAGNFAIGDTNGTTDVFLLDRASSTLILASRAAAAGNFANGASRRPAISADGRFVAFESDASNLVAGDSNGNTDVFVFDREFLTVERSSVGPAGKQFLGISERPALSADGRFVAFESTEITATPIANPNAVRQIVRRDRASGAAVAISADTDGLAGNLVSRAPALDATGEHVAFVSDAAGLVAADTNGDRDAFVRSIPHFVAGAILVGQVAAADVDVARCELVKNAKLKLDVARTLGDARFRVEICSQTGAIVSSFLTKPDGSAKKKFKAPFDGTFSVRIEAASGAGSYQVESALVLPKAAKSRLVKKVASGALIPLALLPGAIVDVAIKEAKPIPGNGQQLRLVDPAAFAIAFGSVLDPGAFFLPILTHVEGRRVGGHALDTSFAGGPAIRLQVEIAQPQGSGSVAVD